MRIIKIALKNFRAYYGEHTIDLGRRGQNLLLYGENGSGKSSLLKAIELFIDSHVRDLNFVSYKNFFVEDTQDGYIKIAVREDRRGAAETSYEWSEDIRQSDDPLIIEASKCRGSLDYKALLEIYFLHPRDNKIDLFDILIKNILKNIPHPVTGNILLDDWETIQGSIPTSRGHTNKISAYEEMLDNFNVGLSQHLSDLEEKASSILQSFNYPLEISFQFEGVNLDIENKRCRDNFIFLDVKFFNSTCPLPHQFLNEAKLSAIALSIYLAALLINPTGALKILVLDDVLIGLDMSNRLPIIDIIKTKFSEYQIFLMTYDKEWHEILKRHFGNDWKKLELYSGSNDDYEIPVLLKSEPSLEKAQFYLNNHDHKAAAVYLRSAFEESIRKFCEDKGVKVKYCSKPSKVSAEDFWNPIKNEKNRDGTRKYVEKELADVVEEYRTLILNPLSHARISFAPKQEIQSAIDTIKTLKTALDAKAAEHPQNS